MPVSAPRTVDHAFSPEAGQRLPKGLIVLAFSLLGSAVATANAGQDPTPGTEGRIPLTVPASGRTGFSRLGPDRTGVHFTNYVAPDALARNQVLEVGSGVALGDVDRDGRCDLYFCALQGGNRLFLNRGDWHFEEVTAASGVGCPEQASTGAVLADLDGDGDLDLLVNSLGGGTRLFLNQGAARFEESRDSGLRRTGGCTSLALADINGDGCLDVYVAHYSTRTVKDDPTGLDDVRAGYVNGEFIITPPGRFLPLFLKSGGVSLFERAEPDVLYLNDGTGRFTPVSWTGGAFLDEQGARLTEEPKDWALAAAFRDLNRDGAPDLYVCNDFFHSPDRIWLNDGTGRFRALPKRSLRTTSMSSMSVDFADINRDGWDDFLVVDMLSRDHERRQRQRGSRIHLDTIVPREDPDYRPEAPRNTLALNRGDGTYAEIAQFAGLDASEWSWGVAFLDVDLDGFEDVLVTTGNLRDANDADLARENSRSMAATPGEPRRRAPLPRLESPSLAFRNQGDLTFRECSQAWGWTNRGVSHGLALADLDQDGDLDVVVNAVDQPAGLYRNDEVKPRLAVRLHGHGHNSQGIGARILVRGGAVPLQSQEIMSGGRYLSGDDPMRVFAAGGLTNRMRVEVTWRNGVTQILDGVTANRRVEIQESIPARGLARGTASTTTPVSPPESRLFEDVSNRLRQTLTHQPFDDFAVQPLLTRRLSDLGPGLCWYDADADGWDDLIVGASRGGRLVLHQNDGKGGFRALRRPELVDRDQTGVLAWRDRQDQVHLLVGMSNYEDGATNGAAVVQYALQGGQGTESLEAISSSPGPLALGQIDGKRVLLVGGRVRAAHYPLPAASRLYTNEAGRWRLDQGGSETLRDAGLVSGATWADLDGDGRLELLLACEWGPIRIFANEKGQWVERTGAWGFDRYQGRWNAVTTGDFDGDGQLDVVGSNWGRNTRYQRYLGARLRVYHGDLDGDGTGELFEAYRDSDTGRYLPFETLDVLRHAAPSIAAAFPRFADFARAGMDEILGDRLRSVTVAEVSTLDSTLFLNRGGRFEARALPSEAQFAPAFGLAVSDFDGDGNEDLFLAQNFFGVDADTSRYDAGRGLVLLGDGRGEFKALPGQTSGIELYGEQRAAATADFDQDGRPDLAVSQHGGPVGLFRNRSGKPGLRVRLAGPPENPDGFGTVIRVCYGDQRGPARTVDGGSGYWSQDSPVQVLGLSSRPTAVWTRWPDGKSSVTPIMPSVAEILVPANGP